MRARYRFDRGVHFVSAPHLAAACTLLFATACGARSDLDVTRPEAGALDAGRFDAAAPDGGRRDAGSRDAALSDAPSVPDAGSVVCPARSDFGFRVMALGRLRPEFSFEDVSLGGDGRSVYLAARDVGSAGELHLYRLDGADAVAREVYTIDVLGGARVSVIDGVARMVAFDGSEFVVIEARADVARELGRTTIYHGTRMVPDRPAWNGTAIILAGLTGFIGPLRFGAESLSWPWLDVEGYATLVAAQAETGLSEVVYRRSLTTMALHTFDRDGTPRGPTSGVALVTSEFWVGPAFGWLDGDDTGQPIVLAGIVQVDGIYRALLQRFRADGTPGSGFSAPIESGWGQVDSTTVPVPPHAHGYGMLAAPFPGPALFHGAGQDFVGDATELPFSCGAASIAAGPCGYVIACLTTEGALELALAIPPELR